MIRRFVPGVMPNDFASARVHDKDTDKNSIYIEPIMSFDTEALGGGQTRAS